MSDVYLGGVYLWKWELLFLFCFKDMCDLCIDGSEQSTYKNLEQAQITRFPKQTSAMFNLFSRCVVPMCHRGRSKNCEASADLT